MIWIVAAFSGFVLLALVFLLAAPIIFEADRREPGRPAHYRLRLVFVHPRLVELTFTLPERQTTMRLVGRPLMRRPSQEEEESFKPPLEPPKSQVPRDEEAVHTGLPQTPPPTGEEDRRGEEAAAEEDRVTPDEHRGRWEEWADGDRDDVAYHPPADENAGPELGRGDGGDESALEGEMGREGHDSFEDTGDDTGGDESSIMGLWHRIRQHRATFFLKQRRWIGKLLRWALRVLRSLLLLIAFERCRVAVKAGTGDHAVTGLVNGAYWGLWGSLRSTRLRGVQVAFEPDFGRVPMLHWQGAVRLRTSVGRLVWPLMVAVGSFPYFSSFLVWRRMKRWEREGRAV
jgi:hypothetical protein